MTQDLIAAIHQWCSTEYRHAVLTMRARPAHTVPTGESADDWTLYTGTWARPLILACLASGVWEPGPET